MDANDENRASSNSEMSEGEDKKIDDTHRDDNNSDVRGKSGEFNESDQDTSEKSYETDIRKNSGKDENNKNVDKSSGHDSAIHNYDSHSYQNVCHSTEPNNDADLSRNEQAGMDIDVTRDDQSSPNIISQNNKQDGKGILSFNDNRIKRTVLVIIRTHSVQILIFPISNSYIIFNSNNFIVLDKEHEEVKPGPIIPPGIPPQNTSPGIKSGTIFNEFQSDEDQAIFHPFLLDAF
ncbi:hypothetical protein I4U23_006068 [Adineta vaga]|nr:hypothetical protein I4U23_006068 [Adineta vaga]